jgi:hypothetical protein
MYTEKEIQRDFVQYLRFNYPNLVFTCNGKFSSVKSAMSCVQMGYRRGIPDLFIADYKLFIELKSKKGKLKSHQINIHEKLEKLGYKVFTCYSLEQAIQTFENIRLEEDVTTCQFDLE